MEKQTIFRDDDLCEHVSPKKHQLFVKVHEIFNKHNCIHHLGLVTRELRGQRYIKSYISEQTNISAQFHCVNHVDFTTLSTEEVKIQFETGIKSIQDELNVTPTMWFPPWQRTNTVINEIANSYNLLPCPRGVRLSDYVLNSPRFVYMASNPRRRKLVLNFHYWDVFDNETYLELAILKYKNEIAHNRIR